MKIILNNSPNFSKESRPAQSINYVIIHYTGMQSEIESIKRLRKPSSKVSCHYLINRKGNIMQMVRDKNIAWHAGKSKWKNVQNLNEKSIGIELVNKGHEFGYQNYTDPQIKNLVKLCLKLKKIYRIKTENFLGHSDIAPLRKSDPGEKFPWKKLSKYNLGRWYKSSKKDFSEINKNKYRNIFFSNLFKIGYRYFNKKKISKKDKTIIKSFKRRYFPQKIDEKLDKKILEISHFLANQ